MKKSIIVALDYAKPADALRFVDSLDPSECRLKVGKELFTAGGPDLVQALHARDFDVFLDLKFHDIPNTVAKAVTAAAELGVWMVNVHASGGQEMMLAARDALIPYGDKAPILIAVTVLTSMSAEQLAATGVTRTLPEQVLALAQNAKGAGLAGVVCSAQEATILRNALGPEFLLVTPGIRPTNSDNHDQKRVMSPGDAVKAGANFLVMGRPIRENSQPNQLLSAINHEISAISS
ncbi:orotidine 5''-phosphate decarboxylase, subfamily 1 [Idiomarina sp. A28L]|uniref:orotidine-5'-phosphate decarboxylase n=1 Tax=Idiomarina sp. A28L TaxID=1036674 RepID=UPI00021388B3|nr:orotidine-5'-phosphate decarboxylase [Idiomarina sp. A28L]EGN74928.1 orotidine 5''-phosphate decarboxylase, subfamily 1 [Idiomarina sp. A28L]